MTATTAEVSRLAHEFDVLKDNMIALVNMANGRIDALDHNDDCRSVEIKQLRERIEKRLDAMGRRATHKDEEIAAIGRARQDGQADLHGRVEALEGMSSAAVSRLEREAAEARMHLEGRIEELEHANEPSTNERARWAGLEDRVDVLEHLTKRVADQKSIERFWPSEDADTIAGMGARITLMEQAIEISDAARLNEEEVRQCADASLSRRIAGSAANLDERIERLEKLLGVTP